jgi:CheY-like chemotaxis protein
VDLTPAKRVPKRARILIIDDEPSVLRAYRRLLAPRHCVVLTGGGAEGLDLIARGEHFDVVICDVMMPQVDGPMFHDALRQKHAALLARVIFCSGGAFTPRAREFLQQVKNPFIQKPIDASVLEEAIQSLLHADGVS